MSVLSLPRVNFAGKTKWNPDTTNNYSDYYESATSEPNFEATQTNPDTYKHYIKENSADSGNWNVYGDQGTSFKDSQVSGVVEVGGPVTDDPWLQRSVKIKGLVSKNGDKKLPARLIDVDPYNSTSSQIFFDTFHLGDETVGVVASHLERFSDRGFFFSRNLNLDNQVMIAGAMGVTWQSSFAKEGLTWYGLDQSAALRRFKARIEAPGSAGMVVRFANYRTQYFTDCEFDGVPITTFDALQQAYLDGFTGSNPAFSVLMGSAGVWLEGESITGPSSRVLVPVAGLPLVPTTPLASSSSSSRAAAFGSKTLGVDSHHKSVAAATLGSAKTYALGPTEAEAVVLGADAGTGHVVLNFVNTIPETNQELTKANFGQLTVQVRDGSTVTPIGTLSYEDYDKAAYDTGAGIVTLPFQSTEVVAALATGTLEVAGPATQVALQESSLVVATDAESVYLNENEVQTIHLTLADRGQPAADGTWSISIAQYLENGLLVTKPERRAAKLLDSTGQELPIQADGTVTLPVVNGAASFQVTPLKEGNFALTYLAHTQGSSPQVPRQLDVSLPLSNARNLPFDSSLQTFAPGETIPWTYIYENVLMVYDLVYPVMSLIIDFHSKEAVDEACKKIQARTGKDMGDDKGPEDIASTSAWMPVTRELSKARQHLLWRYLNQVAAEQAEA